jgi:predicted enzyme related to lactoylglutathione lyase
MEGKVSQVTIVVRDQSKSLEFYTEKVGFEKKTDVTPPGSYRWVTVGLKGQDLEFALFQVGSATDPSQREWSKDWAPGRAPPVVIRVADCKKAYEELKGRGVTFPQPPKEYPWGVAATFVDPDGNLFSLSQPPAAWPKP